MVKINGEVCDVAGRTVAGYLTDAGYGMKRIDVERNGDIIPGPVMTAPFCRMMTMWKW